MMIYDDLTRCECHVHAFYWHVALPRYSINNLFGNLVSSVSTAVLTHDDMYFLNRGRGPVPTSARACTMTSLVNYPYLVVVFPGFRIFPVSEF
jgi:hypothetical protein